MLEVPVIVIAGELVLLEKKFEVDVVVGLRESCKPKPLVLAPMRLIVPEFAYMIVPLSKQRPSPPVAPDAPLIDMEPPPEK